MQIDDKRADRLAKRAAATRRYYAKNRAEIAAKRLKAYQASRPGGPRIATAAAYRPTKNESARLARAADPDKFRERYANVSDAVKQKRAARQRAYSQKNKEQIRKSAAARQMADPIGWQLAERVRKQKRRAQRVKAYPKWGRKKTDQHMRSLAALCRILEMVTGETWHIDHMYPLQNPVVCGLHVWNNLQVLPGRLNLKKYNNLIYTQPGEWRADY